MKVRKELIEELDLADKPNPWKKIDSKIVYSNPWISVREDNVLRPDGERGIYGVVDTRIATGVVAVDDDYIYLVGQYRYPLDCYSWELIEGGTDPGEDPLAAIQRELLEEAGLTAKSWAPLGPEIHLSNCCTSERGFLYLATDITVGQAAPDDTEELEIRRVHRDKVRELLEGGFITDCMSIVGLYRYFASLRV